MTQDGIQYKYVRVIDQVYSKTNPNCVKEINDLLASGWIPVRECSFNGSSYSGGSSILVLLMRTMKTADVTMTEVFDAPEQEIEITPPAPHVDLSEFSGLA